MKKKSGIVCTFYLSFAMMLPGAADTPRMPMPVNYADSASVRWLGKNVLSSRLLDDMENIRTWSFRGKGEMSLTSEHSRDGGHSIRLRARTRTAEDLSPKSQRNYGTAAVYRSFAGEDWTAYNRISFWVYPDLPGWLVVDFRIRLFNDGKVKIPGSLYSDELYHCAVVRNHVWNHVVWEFSDLPRDKVVGVEFELRRQGNEPEASDTLTFDFDQLELQRVVPDHVEGWDVWPGRIAFSQTGYQPGAPKTAVASNLTAREFQLIRNETGEAVLTKAVRTVKGRIGRFQVLDFSEVTEPGTYFLRAGDVVTSPFRIQDNVWRETIWKALNFYYAERCGMAIPGVHRECHRDWTVSHGNRRIVINGGWHDAGDLSQGVVNTSEAIYSMFSLAEQLRARCEDDDLCRRLIEEAKWGLAWVLKTSFGDGYRATWATMGLWTDGILGDNDDIVAQAANSPYENFMASASEAIASRILAREDPDLAAYSLRRAREDWKFAVAGITNQGHPLEIASEGILASLELYRATGESLYKSKAVELARIVANSQQRSFLPDLTVPITGFFYTGPDKQTLLHYIHRGHEQAPIVALAGLCDAFPDHPDWMKWYAAVTLHSEYFQKAMAELTAPFRMLPNSIHSTDEYLKAPKGDREAVRQQILNGFKVGARHYVRAYAVQPSSVFRGNYGTLLSQTKAVSTAAHLRGDLALAGLCEKQLYWVVGRNPFAESTMYGEGYDFTPQYSAMSGDIVGSLPVGIKSRENFDVPYWPVHNHPNYKEVWVHPVSRWIWLMRDLSGPALVEGHVSPGHVLRFRELASGKVTTIRPEFATGRFRATLPEGRYEASSGQETRHVTLLPAGTYSLDLIPGRNVDFQVAQETKPDGNVTITVTAQGSGVHTFAIRSENLFLAGSKKSVRLDAGKHQTIVWQGKMASTDAPWVAVVIPDHDVAQRQEAVGTTRTR